jgi:chromosome segregation ATPase
METKSLQANYEALKTEKESCLKELKQMKIRFENLKQKEKENSIHYERTLNGLEKENESLNNRYADLSSQMDDCQRKHDSTKCQLNKYEQLIDSLNEQIIILKRECKENQLNLKQTTHNLEVELELKSKLDAKCQELESLLNFKQQALAKYENYERNISNIQTKYKQMQSALTSK